MQQAYKMGRLIIDTNVAVIANGTNSPQASPDCRLKCVAILALLFGGERQLVLDDRWAVLGEYKANLRPSNGGLGDRFLQWVLQNYMGPLCERVPITQHESRGFAEFPIDDRLSDFDPADRKWIALSRACTELLDESVPIVEAADMKWRAYLTVFRDYQVEIDFICDGSQAAGPRRARKRNKQAKA